MAATFKSAVFQAKSDPIQPSFAAKTAVFYALLYGCGIVFGVIAYFALPQWMRDNLATQITSLIQTMRMSVVHHTDTGLSAFMDAVYGALIILFFWMAGHIPIGTPFLVFGTFLRAVSLGLALTGTINAFGLSGAEFDLLGVIPWNILTGVAVVVSATVSSLYIHQGRGSGGFAAKRYTVYCTAHIMCTGLVMLAGMLQIQVMAKALLFVS